MHKDFVVKTQSNVPIPTQCFIYALNIKCYSPKSFLPVDTPGKGETGGNVEDHTDPTAQADDDQSPADAGQDVALATQVLASDRVAD